MYRPGPNEGQENSPYESLDPIAGLGPFIRTRSAVTRAITVECDERGETVTDAGVVRVRQSRAGPVLAPVSDWLDGRRRHATPRRRSGPALERSRNQWPPLARDRNDGRFALDHGAGARAIRPRAIGRADWVQIGGEGGPTTASVLLGVSAGAMRPRPNPWADLRDGLEPLAARSVVDDAGDRLPETWAIRASAR